MDQVTGLEQDAALLVFYSNSLEQTLNKVEQNGGVITKPVFDIRTFPYGLISDL